MAGARAPRDGDRERPSGNPKPPRYGRTVRITKHEHACLEVNSADRTLIIDPGSFLSAIEPQDVVGVVITHEHADHWTPDHVRRILERNPDARVLGPQGVATAAAGEDFGVEVVHAGDTVDVGGFELRFFGGRHAVLHESIPVIDNVGVLVDGELFYGGDSMEVPEVEVPTLAAPMGGPWQTVGDAMDFVLAVAPKRTFPVHDMPLSVAGRGIWLPRLAWAAEQSGTFADLAPGEALDI